MIGRADLIKKIRRNPLKRALQMDKLGLAALVATLALYEDPDRLTRRLPTLRWLTRPADDVRAMADALAPAVAMPSPHMAGDVGGLPKRDRLRLPPRRGDRQLGDQDPTEERQAGQNLDRLAASFRKLPIPVIGRISDGALWLDSDASTMSRAAAS